MKTRLDETQKNLTTDDTEKDITATMGIYWGTFDPPTLAHGNIIEKSMHDLKLSKLIIVINDNNATGKNYKSPGKDRIHMLKSMISAAARDRLIILRQTDFFSFSYENIKKIYPDKNIAAIVGEDSFDGESEEFLLFVSSRSDNF